MHDMVEIDSGYADHDWKVSKTEIKKLYFLFAGMCVGHMQISSPNKFLNQLQFFLFWDFQQHWLLLEYQAIKTLPFTEDPF